jgi:hypothetical protein
VVQDASGNLVSSAESPVTLAIATNTSAATLSGTVTVNASGGVATFADLQVTRVGTGYTMSASADGLAGATSTTFDVMPAAGVAAGMAPLAGDGQTAMVGQPVATKPAVKVTDGFGAPVANVTVKFSVDTTPGTGEDRTTDANGVAAVNEWKLGTVAGEQRLIATSRGLHGSPVTFIRQGKARPTSRYRSAGWRGSDGEPGCSGSRAPISSRDRHLW